MQHGAEASPCDAADSWNSDVSRHRPVVFSPALKRSNYLQLTDTHSRNWVFSPESSFLFFWDFVMIVLLVYQSFVLPYSICFDPPLPLPMLYFDFLIVLFFLADILLGFHKAYYHRGHVVLSRRKIAVKYIKFWFWIDLLASIPYNWIEGSVFEQERQNGQDQTLSLSFTPQLLRLVRLLRFLRLLRLAKLKQAVFHMEELVSSHWISSTFLFCQLLFMILALAHWLACFWFFFGNAESLHHEQTWVSVLRQKLADEGSDTAMYVTALYWTITTMTTVGYGDVVPESRQEKIFAIGTMMLSSWSFAYVLGSISGLISQSAEREAVLRAQTRGVNRFLRKYEIGKSLQFRVRRFLQYRLDEQRDQNYDERELLELLSSSLRMEISDFINGAILRVVPVFAEWEAMVISNLSRHLRTGSCSPGDVIVTQGEVTTELYFVQTGKVDIVYNTSSIRILGRREYFGEIGFFLKQPRCSSAKAVLFVELLSLKRNELMKIVEIYPEVKQLLEDTVFSKTENVLSSIGVICYHCEGLGHVACGCPSIFGFEERRQRLINRHRPQTKYISLVGESPAHIHRNPYRHVRAKPNIHNVVGIPNCTPERIFPNTPRLRMLMETYSSELESLPRKRDVDIRAVKSLANMEEDWSRRRAKQFSLLFENEAAAEVEPQQRLRTLSFRRTLLRSFRKDPVLDLVCEDSTKQPADDSARSCHRFLAKEPLFPERLVRLPSSFMT